MTRKPRSRVRSIRSLCAGAALALFLGACAAGPPAPRSDDPLALDIEAVRARHPGKTLSVAFRDLGDGRTVLLDAGVELHAASTMKVPVMMEVWRQAGEGRIRLDDELGVTDTFRSIVDGSPYRLDPAEDSEATLYARLGKRVSVRELVRLMIVRSSNLATNMLIELVGAESVQRLVDGLGVRMMKVRRGVEDSKAFAQGLNNVTSAADLLLVLEALARGRPSGPAAAADMIGILQAQEFNEMIPAGLPPEVRPRVAHKTGQITRVHHDAAIVLPEDGPGFVLVVLTAGFDDPAASAAVVAEIASVAWRHRSPPETPPAR